MGADPLEETLVLTTQEQAKALMHPLRQKILRHLLGGPATPSEAAKAIGVAPNKAHYHVRMLEKAGLVRLVETRTAGIVTEHFFERTARQYAIQPNDAQGDLDLASTMPLFRHVLHEVMADAHVVIDQGVGTVQEENMLMAIQAMAASEACRSEIELAVRRVLDQFGRSVATTPDQEYWLLTAWVPRQRREHAPEEE